MTKAADYSEPAEGILVAIRMRPLNSKESVSQQSTETDADAPPPTTNRVWRVLPSYNSVTQTTPDGGPCKERVNGKTFFSYDKAYGEASSTADVYEETGRKIVSSVCKGMNGTVFAYGQTSSGKTFTMQGSEPNIHAEHPGIVHMATADIFKAIEHDDNRDFLLRVSFIEIYNEETRDLLNQSAPLNIREDPKKGVYVDAKETIVTSFEQVLNVLEAGEKIRHVGSTSMNERSSRSHTIFRITLESRMKNEDGDAIADARAPAADSIVRVSTLNLVDLAGSESVRLTGASGERQKEGGKINQSLLTLSRVIHSLGEASTTNGFVHVNYRDSKLTRILQPNLSGNARIAVICCATPSELYLEETRSTLQFAARAKLVKTRAKVNEVLDDRAVIKKLQKELSEARLLAGGKKAIEHLNNLTAERDALKVQKDSTEESLQNLKNSIIKGGTLFDPLNTLPDCLTPHRNRSNKRRQTAAPGTTGLPPSSLLFSPPTAPALSDNRRKSVGTALHRSPPPLTNAPPLSQLAQFVASTSDNSNNRRLSGGSVASSATSASTQSIAGNSNSGSSEIDLLRQALQSKGRQAKTLKAKLELLQGDSSTQLTLMEAKIAALTASHTTLSTECDEATTMCEELMKEKEELILSRNDLLSSTEELTGERDILLLEQEKNTIMNTDSIAAAALKDETIASTKQTLDQTQMELSDVIARHEAAVLTKDETTRALDETQKALGDMTDQHTALTTAHESLTASNEVLQTKLDTAEGNLAAATKKTGQLQFNLDAARGDNEDLLETVNGGASDNTELATELMHAQSELELAQSQLATVTTEASEAVKNASSLSELLKSTEVEIETYKADMAATKAELNDALDMAEDYKDQAEQVAASEEFQAELEAARKAAEQQVKTLKATHTEEKARIALEFQTATASIREEVKDLESELAGSQTDELEYKQQAADLATKLASAEKSFRESKEQLEEVKDQVETLQLSGTAARNAADEANSDVVELKSRLRKLESENNELVAKSSVASESSAVEEKLREEMVSKDARIKKLEAVRLTKDQCAALKKMKEERIQFMRRCKELEVINEKLRNGAGGGAIDEANVAEISNLKTSNTALTDKLRKYASHCQKLEGERAAVIDNVTSLEKNVNKDFVGSIAIVVERVQAAEEECDALASAETRANTYLTQLDREREDKEKGRETIQTLKEQVGSLTEKEKGLSLQLHSSEEKVTELLEEMEKFIKSTSELNGKVGEVETVSTKKVRFLEQENLQLMQDQKQLKREMQGYKAELQAYKVTGSAVREPLVSVDDNKGVEGGEGEESASATKLRGIAAIAEGNESLVDDENTGECKQS